MSNNNEKSLISSTKIGTISEILQTAHPEIFKKTFPSQEKDGPIVKHGTADNATSTSAFANTSDATYSEVRNPNTSFSRNIAASLDEVMRQREMGLLASDGSDSSKMLSIVVSTIILMATKEHKIPIEYYMWTEQYLKCIKDDKGRIPPNVAGLLKHIRLICKEENFEWNRSWGTLPNSSEEVEFNQNDITSNRFDKNSKSTETSKEKVCPNISICCKELEQDCETVCKIQNCKDCNKSKMCEKDKHNVNESEDFNNGNDKKKRNSKSVIFT